MAEGLASSLSSIGLGSDFYIDRPVVAAIDFGTSTTGYAFAFKDDGSAQIKSSAVFLNKWQVGSVSSVTDKAPTTVLLKPDKTFDSFGYKAEDKYAKLCETGKQKGWWYFQKFKMLLYQTKNLSRDVVIKDAEEKCMPAIEVFSTVIAHLKENILNDVRIQNSVITDNDVLYVLTVPAIWSDAAKQFMREAATAPVVGIKADQLKLVLEPEAASVYCRQTLSDAVRKSDGSVELTTLPVGHRYIIVDLGGGTLDIATHEVIDDDKIHEIHMASGDDLGGQVFNAIFLDFLAELIGREIFTTWTKTEPADYLVLLRLIEGFKWEIAKSSEDVLLRVDISLLDLLNGSHTKTLENAVSKSKYKDYVDVVGKGKLCLKNDVLRDFFDSIIYGIKEHISRITNDTQNVESVFIVGGLAKAPYIRKQLQGQFPRLRFIVPEDPVVATLKGAVLLGNMPHTIAGRIARYSYGVHIAGPFIEGVHKKEYMYIRHGKQMCRYLFERLIEKEQVLKFNDTFMLNLEGNPETQKQRHQTKCISLYQAQLKDPMYITDEGCKELATIKMEPPPEGWPDINSVVAQLVVGEAEFKFMVQCNGKAYELKVDFLLKDNIFITGFLGKIGHSDIANTIDPGQLTSPK